ncbi:MAG: hypothetical protein A2X49_08225 [Lentisphaerae bacterium GWF2_52_8]|nr:MAG: hypothetical protein A2X49_08225 [Lentisphaerae bacterium GWF2_52_8]
MEQKKQPRINCLRCEHYIVTWDPKFPRACRVFSFKGKEFPSETVWKVTGKACPAFKQKSGHHNSGGDGQEA